MTVGSPTIRADEKESGRVEAFSDGVFAIAMTLLTLDLKVPSLADGTALPDLGMALSRQWSPYVAFITSFFTVLIIWLNHHAMFKLVRRVYVRLLLMTAPVVPFSTELVAFPEAGRAAGLHHLCRDFRPGQHLP
jgi:uncharacterized membrane protein